MDFLPRFRGHGGAANSVWATRGRVTEESLELFVPWLPADGCHSKLVCVCVCDKLSDQANFIFVDHDFPTSTLNFSNFNTEVLAR